MMLARGGAALCPWLRSFAPAGARIEFEFGSLSILRRVRALNVWHRFAAYLRLAALGVAISIGATERFAPYFTCALRVGVGYS